MKKLIALLTLTSLAFGGEVSFQWDDNSTTETLFHIERSTSSVPYAEIGTVGTNVTTFTDVNAQQGQTYNYRVRASNAGGFSGYTNTLTVFVPVPPPPTPPPPSNLRLIDVVSVSLERVESKSGTTATARVKVEDSKGLPVSGVLLELRWSGIVKGTSLGTTDSNGIRVATSGKSKKAGSVTATIAKVTPPTGSQYDPNLSNEPLTRTIVLN